MSKFYAVKEGRKKGIFNTWDECQEQVKGYKGAKFKSFKTIEEAKDYLGDCDAPSLTPGQKEEVLYLIEQIIEHSKSNPELVKLYAGNIADVLGI